MTLIERSVAHKVLLVDDDDAVRDMLSPQLTQSMDGYMTLMRKSAAA